MRNLLVALLLTLPLSLCKAQTAPAKPVEPTAIGVVYRLDPTSQELRKLPDEQWKGIEVCQNTFGSSSYISCIEVSGDHSPFRLKAGDKIEFVFKTGSPEKVSLYPLNLKKKHRRFDVAKCKSSCALNSTPIKGLPIEVSQFGEHSYKLVPASQFAPGEYAIIIADEVYTFGVDQ
jgi:hypothetical protein